MRSPSDVGAIARSAGDELARLRAKPPRVHCITNSVAQMPGYTAIAYGYRKHLDGQRPRIVALVWPVIAGGLLASHIRHAASASKGADEMDEVWLLIGRPQQSAVVEKLFNSLTDAIHQIDAMPIGAAGVSANRRSSPLNSRRR